MKLFIASDIHGFYDEWMQALEEKGFEKDNPNHGIVVLGDLLDRGRQPKECLEFVNSLPEERKILIKGNHEYLMEEMLARKHFYEHDMSNGTALTPLDFFEMKDCSYEAFPGVCDRFVNDEQWKKYINSCIDYWENEKVVFVHGWIPCKGISYGVKIIEAEYDPDWRNGRWDESCWYNGMQLWDQGIRVPNKTVWCGHWNSSWGHSHLHGKGVEWPEDGKKIYFKPFEEVGIVAMDGCVALNKKVNVKTITVKKEDVEKGKENGRNAG